MKEIIELTSGVDQRDMDDNTPLHFAASSGNVEFIELLQKKMYAGNWLEVDFNAANILERTPLHRAAAKGHAEMVNILLTNGASVNLKDVSRRTALHYAALGGDFKVVEALLAKRANPAAVDIHGRSPLHIAAAAATNPTIVRSLMERGDSALLMMTDKDGKTALDLVTDNANQVLTKFELNPSDQLQNQLSDLNYIIQNLLTTEEGHTKDWNPLHFAVRSGEIPAVETLLRMERAMKKDPTQLLNSKDKHGATPLHIAAISGHRELAELLIKNGCDFYCQDSNREGALMLAVKHGQADVVKLLLKKMREDNEADVVGGAINTMGINPLHWAAANGNYELVVKLVQLGGAKPGTCDKLGMTALHHAAHRAIAEFLLQETLDHVDTADKTGNTPLHYAATCGRIGVVNLLLSQFLAQPNQDPVLVRAGHYDMKLYDYIMNENKTGETALHCAARGLVSSHYKRKMALYNGTMLEPEMFVELESATKSWHRTIMGNTQHEHGLGADEVDGLCQGSFQWQDEFMKLLLKLNGEDYDDRNLKGDAVAVVLLLLQHGADIEATDKNEESPLHLAARWGRLATTEALLQTPPASRWMKANVTAQDIHGDTPLHLAARWGHEDIVRLLVEEGAGVEEKNDYNQSPAEVAERHLQFEVVELLLELRTEADSSATGTAVPAASDQSAPPCYQ